MNGTTNIDATLNPGSAEMDKHTYGWKNINVSFRGKRLIRLEIGRLMIDAYFSSMKPFTSMGGGAEGSARYWMLFWPLGQVRWITRKANRGIDGLFPSMQ